MRTPEALDALELKIVETAVARGWQILRPADTSLWMATSDPPDLQLRDNTWGPTMKRLPAAVMDRLAAHGVIEAAPQKSASGSPPGQRYRLTPAALTALHMANGFPGPELDPSRFPVIGTRLGRDLDDGTAWGVISLVTPAIARAVAAALAELARIRAQEGAIARMPTLEMPGRMVAIASFQAMRMRAVTPTVWTGHAGELFAGTEPGHDLHIRHVGGAYGEAIRILAERPSRSDTWTEIGSWREEHLAETLLDHEIGKDPGVGPPLLEGFMNGYYS